MKSCRWASDDTCIRLRKCTPACCTHRPKRARHNSVDRKLTGRTAALDDRILKLTLQYKPQHARRLQLDGLVLQPLGMQTVATALYANCSLLSLLPKECRHFATHTLQMHAIKASQGGLQRAHTGSSSFLDCQSVNFVILTCGMTHEQDTPEHHRQVLTCRSAWERKTPKGGSCRWQAQS